SLYNLQWMFTRHARLGFSCSRKIKKLDFLGLSMPVVLELEIEERFRKKLGFSYNFLLGTAQAGGTTCSRKKTKPNHHATKVDVINKDGGHNSNRRTTCKELRPVIVAPCTPSPKAMLQLSSIDNIPGLRNVINNLLFVYNATSDKKISALDPAKIIREALSKVLVYYYPFAGRFRSKENGELELECTDEGALFVEATADNDLSVLGDLDHLRPSFQHLLFWHPPHTHVEALHLLALQVTHFTCGGFVLGVSFHHSICDARGGARFLQGLAEMARGYDKPSVEPIWDRELLKLENPTRLQFYHMELNMESIQLPPTIVEESVLAFLVINYETIKRMKKSIAKECKHFFSAFDVVAALAWRARTKALQIPLAENENLSLQ
ncbi:hypothetical protein KI387_028562, partial [Taxus chinensis]